MLPKIKGSESLYFDGGPQAITQRKKLHDDLDKALSIISGLQQPTRPLFDDSGEKEKRSRKRIKKMLRKYADKFSLLFRDYLEDDE